MKIPFALLATLLAPGLASPATLRPSMIIHGVIRDSYGLRLSPQSAMVSAFLGTNVNASEVARTPIRVQPAGENYRFELNVTDPATARPNDVIPGATVSIRVRMGLSLPVFIGSGTFTARGDGSSMNINLTLGSDSDGDGLPDDWERMVIDNSFGTVTNLNQIGPGHDLDHDGIPDDLEFLNGTFPFLPDDELRMSALQLTQGGRLSFSFTSILGATYAVESTPNLGPLEWSATPVALQESGLLSFTQFTGNGQLVTVYFSPGGPSYFYRLRSR